ncbi:MAG: hypothetical protein KDN18_08600 [Verrucomicrobiae bacterium]|nr:hypothetical protein [Verrucomicrobiae bacterium]
MRSLFLLVALSGIAWNAAAQDRDSRAGAIVDAVVEDSRTIVHRKTGSALFYVRLKAKVLAVEKGRELVRGADYLDIRCWREGKAGHDPIPADGQRFRTWILPHKDGYWLPLEPDGFELVDGSEGRTFPSVQRRDSLVGILVGGLIGLLILAGAAFARYRGRIPRDRSWGEARRGDEDEES